MNYTNSNPMERDSISISTSKYTNIEVSLNRDMNAILVGTEGMRARVLVFVLIGERERDLYPKESCVLFFLKKTFENGVHERKPKKTKTKQLI